jgi:hypothetical protein
MRKFLKREPFEDGDMAGSEGRCVREVRGYAKNHLLFW